MGEKMALEMAQKMASASTDRQSRSMDKIAWRQISSKLEQKLMLVRHQNCFHEKGKKKKKKKTKQKKPEMKKGNKRIKKEK